MSQDAIPPTADPSLAVSNLAVEEPNASLDPVAIVPPSGSYVKHAMRNMVRKRSKSLQHFFLSTVGLLGLFIALAYLTK